MRNWLKDKYVVLTGASGGIGRELCKLLVCKYNVNVIGIGRSEEKMQSLITELGENASRFSYYLFDVGDNEAWLRFAKALKNEQKQPCLLINNAGAFPTFEKALNTDLDTTERILRTNFYSVVYGTKALMPILQGDDKNKAGVVNVCSSAALCTVVGTSAYSASKAAVKAYTESLQLEEKGGKYIAVFYPGTTATELFRSDEKAQNSAMDLIAMPAEKMAKKIAGKILKKKSRAVIGWDAKLMNWLIKIAPLRGSLLIRWVMKSSRSKVFSRIFECENK